MASREKLLREYVRGILKEGEGSTGADFAANFAYGFGGGYVEPSDMYTAFIKPFTNVIDVAKGKTKQMMTATFELGRVAIEAALTTIIPVLASDYDKIFQKYEGRMDKIKEEYKDIYDSSWTAFTDNDVVLAGFAMYPALMVNQIAVRKAPIPVIHTLDALTGGFFEDYFNGLIRLLNPDEKKADLGGSSGGGGRGYGGYGYGDYGGFDGGGFGEGLIREEGEKKKPSIVDRILHPKVMAAIEKNPKVQRMMGESRDILRETLEELFDRAQKVARARDLKQLQGVIGKPIKGMDKISQLPPDQQRATSEQIMGNIRKAMINMYVKNLTEQAKGAIAAGVPENHPLVSDLRTAAKKIKSL